MSSSLQQTRSLGINPIDDTEPSFPNDEIVGDHLYDECVLSKELSVCHMLVNFVTACVSLRTDQRMSHLPIRVNYKHCRTI